MSIHYFKINSPIFCCPLFSENYHNPQVRINKIINKHTVDYHPSPSQLISRIQPLIFLWTPKWFISPEPFLIFFLNLYIPPLLRKSFKFIVLNTFIVQIHFWVKKLNFSFLLGRPRKTLPQVFLIISQANGNCPFLSNSVFWRYFFLRRKGGENYEVEKITKNNKGIGLKFW